MTWLAAVGRGALLDEYSALNEREYFAHAIDVFIAKFRNEVMLLLIDDLRRRVEQRRWHQTYALAFSRTREDLKEIDPDLYNFIVNELVGHNINNLR